MTVELLSEWIKNKVIPAFTVVSVTYCKKVPGFSTFDTSDQVKIIKFGQSPSRMLAAVLHWFEPATKNFKHFLSWRDHVPGMNDRFKQSLIKFALKMQELHLDPIEAALLNSLIIVSTAKYGMPNDRLEKLFQNIPELRKLGLLHNEMTNTKTMMAEEFGDRLLLLLNL